jgi:hypothetical protein
VSQGACPASSSARSAPKALDDLRAARLTPIDEGPPGTESPAGLPVSGSLNGRLRARGVILGFAMTLDGGSKRAGAGEIFVRLQAPYRGRTGVEVGIFVAVDHLRRADRLTEDEEELYFDVDDWFEVHLANPPFYGDGNTLGAVTWFKRSSTEEMRQRLEPLCRILDKYGVTWVAAESTDPGVIIYEDRFQVGVIPHQRFEPTPMPQGVVLGPSTSGSKRHLGKRARRAAQGL